MIILLWWLASLSILLILGLSLGFGIWDFGLLVFILCLVYVFVRLWVFVLFVVVGSVWLVAF